MIQCDRLIEGRKTDVVPIEKRKKEVKIIGIAISKDKTVKEEMKKLNKC